MPHGSMAEVGELGGQNRLDLLRVSGDEDSLGSRQAELGECSLSRRQVIQLSRTPIDKLVVVLILANLVV